MEETWVEKLILDGVLFTCNVGVLVLFVFYAISFVSAAEKEGGQRETGKAD